ncbi:hypothetical protein D5F52_04290 [Brevibacillus laterosporus]|nr:hypothetical protein D5F52_04290 [Brevibacillus laterosporus]MBM7111354.1 hypothetical protein [Brevibacillus laterosporus]
MQGTHIRLRLLVDKDSFDTISIELEEMIDEKLSIVTSRPLPFIKRLIPIQKEVQQE